MYKVPRTNVTRSLDFAGAGSSLNESSVDNKLNQVEESVHT